MDMKRFLAVILLAVTLPTLCIVPLTGCNGLKPAPVAAGEDSVIVNAERIQNSSLDIYEQVTEWEFENRATLPVGVSRAVDKYRAEFKPAWKTSRVILEDYKAKRGPDATAVAKVTAALSAAQSALLNLKLGQTEGDILQANNSITQLINSVRILFSTPAPIVPVPPTPTP